MLAANSTGTQFTVSVITEADAVKLKWTYLSTQWVTVLRVYVITGSDTAVKLN